MGRINSLGKIPDDVLGAKKGDRKKKKATALTAVGKVLKPKGRVPAGIKTAKPSRNRKLSGAVSLAPKSSAKKSSSRTKVDRDGDFDNSRKGEVEADEGPSLGKRLTAIASGVRPGKGKISRIVSGALSGAAIGQTLTEANVATKNKRARRKREAAERERGKKDNEKNES